MGGYAILLVVTGMILFSAIDTAPVIWQTEAEIGRTLTCDEAYTRREIDATLYAEHRTQADIVYLFNLVLTRVASAVRCAYVDGLQIDCSLPTYSFDCHCRVGNTRHHHPLLSARYSTDRLRDGITCYLALTHCAHSQLRLPAYMKCSPLFLFKKRGIIE
jgi:hypothetical protein